MNMVHDRDMWRITQFGLLLYIEQYRGQSYLASIGKVVPIYREEACVETRCQVATGLHPASSRVSSTLLHHPCLVFQVPASSSRRGLVRPVRSRPFGQNWSGRAGRDGSGRWNSNAVHSGPLVLEQSLLTRVAKNSFNAPRWK